MDKPFVRRHYFIDKGLQLRYLFSFIIPMAIFLILFALVMSMLSRSLVERVIQEIKTDMTGIIQNNTRYIFESNFDSLSQDARAVMKKTDATFSSIERQMNTQFRNYSEGKSKFIFGIIRTTMLVLIGGMALILFFLGLLTIYISHKIAGPNFRFCKFAESMREGDMKTRIYLRLGDEFHHTAGLLNEMGDTIEARFKYMKNVLKESREKLSEGDVEKAKLSLDEGLKAISSLKLSDDS